MFLLKGVSRRVIVIKSPDPNMFEEAIFIVKEDRLSKGVTQAQIMREAREVADSYIRRNVTKQKVKPVPAPLFAVLGGLTTACLFIAAQLIF